MLKNKKKRNSYQKLGLILIIVSLIFCLLVCYINLLPRKYLNITIISLLVFNCFNVMCLNLKRLKIKIKKFISFFVLLVVFVLSIMSFYLSRTIWVLKGNGESDYKLENYSVVVLKDSSYDKLEKLKNKNISYYEKSLGYEEANNRLNVDVKVKFHGYSDLNLLIEDLINESVDGFLIENSLLEIMKEENQNLENKIKVIYSFPIKIKNESILKNVDVIKEPFALYISGIDTYGKINSVSRSDVNIVLVINPSTKQILIVSIPRDYYVQLHGTTGYKDKLTHAGIYGIDMSVKTIEDLLDININYYLKVNFTSVIDIVNALGGVEVYSEYTFISYSNYSFEEGYNKVNGEKALDFARTRKAFSDGDRQRGKNQEELIEAIIKKVTSKSILTKYNSLLNAIDGKYQTNMSMDKITSLIKMQLNDMSSWTIVKCDLDGTDSKQYTYTYSRLLYVMEPSEESILEVKELIKKISGNKLLNN